MDNRPTPENFVFLQSEVEKKYFKTAFKSDEQKNARALWECILSTLQGAPHFREYLTEDINILLDWAENRRPLLSNAENLINDCSSFLSYEYCEELRAITGPRRKYCVKHPEDIAKAIVAGFEDDDQLRRCFLHWVESSCDYTYPYKCLVHERENEPISQRNYLAQRCGISGAELKSLAQAYITTRNKLEHDATAYKNLTRERAIYDLLAAYRVMSVFPATESVSKLRERAEAAAKKLQNAPIPLEQVELYFKEKGIIEELRDYLLQSKFEERIEGNYLYLTSWEDLQKGIDSFLNVQRIITYESKNSQHRKELRCSQSAIETLCSYTGGRLATDQIIEIISKSVVLGTENAWRDAPTREFIANIASRILVQNGRKILMDSGCRTELRETDDDPQSHKANNQRRAMFKLDRLGYLPQIIGRSTQSADILIDIAKTYPTLRFCYLVTEEDLPLIFNLTKSCRNVIPFFAYTDKPGGEVFCRIEMMPQVLGNMVRDAALRRSSLVKNVAEAGTVPVDWEIRDEQAQPENTPTEAPSDSASAKSTNLCTKGSVLKKTGGETITLGDVIGSGGEAEIFATSEEGVAAKIYRVQPLTPEKQNKLAYMIQNMPADQTHLCWPKELLYSQSGELVGFTMKKLRPNTFEFQKTVMSLSKSNIRAGRMKNWTRESIVRLASEVCMTMKRLPRDVHIGDINPRNFILNPAVVPSPTQKPEFWIVDCDSFQVRNWPCEVGTQEFTSPRIYAKYGLKPAFSSVERTDEDERFAVATMIFKMLMLGELPYTSVGGGFGPESILKQNFSYRHKTDGGDCSGKDAPDGPFRIIWSNMPARVKDMFVAAFCVDKDGKYLPPGNDQWIDVLREYAWMIQSNRSSNEIVPELYFDPNKKWTADYTCQICGKTRNMHREEYLRRLRMHQPLLCNSCRNAMKESLHRKDEYLEYACKCCGKRMSMNCFELRLIELGYQDHAYCEVCKQPETVRCGTRGCGQLVTKPHYFLAEVKQKKRQIYCKSCMEKIEVECSACGARITKHKYQLDRLNKTGNCVLCDACLNRNRR